MRASIIARISCMLKSAHLHNKLMGKELFPSILGARKQAAEPLVAAIEPANSSVLLTGIEPARHARNHEKLQIKHIKHLLKCFNSW